MRHGRRAGRRLRAEATEEEHDPDLFDESAELAAIEAALGKVTFDVRRRQWPPPSTPTGPSRRGPRA